MRITLYRQLVSSVSRDQAVALVTAGASGIGRTIADALWTQGYRVVVLDINREFLRDYSTRHGEDTAIHCDVADPVAVDRVLVDLLASLSRVDLLVNNAGISGPTALVEEIGVEEWQNTIATDLNSLFYVTRHVIPLMKKQRSGVIINMASNAGLFGCPQRSPYAASKWAAVGLAKTWAMELGPWNICVNAICPGSVSGPRIDQVIERDAALRGQSPADIRARYEQQNSLKRFVSADDIAAMVTFLAGPGGVNISGQAIAIDGHTETLA